MKRDHHWLFYSQAAWNIDQAANIARTLIDNPPDPNRYPTKVTWYAAYNFSIVSYCSPFMPFFTKDGREKGLGVDVVPKGFLEIHSKIRSYRDKILAHADIAHMRVHGLDEEFPIACENAQFSAPSIDDAFALFSEMSKIMIQRLDDFEKNIKQEG
jgi:hypothetical protein